MRQEALKRANTGEYYTKTSKRGKSYKAPYYYCEKCKSKEEKPQVDHIRPVVPISGFDNWSKYIERLFIDSSGLEVLCKPCHKAKTDVHREVRKKLKKMLTED